MKQEHPASQTNHFLSSWLQQFDETNIILNMADQCQGCGIFIIDQLGKVILWSQAATQMTGLDQSLTIGQACPEEYNISSSSSATERRIKTSQARGESVELRLVSHPLYNREQVFSGTLCFLYWLSDSSPCIRPADPAKNQVGSNFHGILSRSPAMEPVFQIIQNAAKTEATVLVRGESGSGKELVARAIHNLSSRNNAPFLAINCAALSVNLLESELFGHVRGAFSGAVKDHDGLLKRAHGGTLFLDEVAELPLELQAKLLRVLQERNYLPVGAVNSIAVDVRIVAATHRSLREEVKKGNFREDLMYRLRVVPIFIPPLRERREDIHLLLWHFIGKHNSQGHRKIDTIDPLAMRLLLDYRWPGNIRELQNVLEYAFVVGQDSVLRLTELPPEFREKYEGAITANSRTAIVSAVDEKTTISHALAQCEGNINQAAELLGMSRATFWRKRKQYGLN